MSRSLAAFAEFVQRLKIDALIDSFEVFFFSLTRPQRDALRRFGELKPAHLGWGTYRLVMTRPTRKTLQRLDYYILKYRGIPCRLDIALEISGGDRKLVRLWIVTHAILRYRRRGPMKPDEATLYWAPKYSRRNLVVYDDKVHRVSGEKECCHFELKLRRAVTLRAHGIHSVADVLALDPHKLFALNLHWSDVAERYATMVVRRNVAKVERESAGRELDEFEACYHASLPQWLATRLRVEGLHQGQRVKDCFPWRLNKAKKLVGLPIPTRLTWPQRKARPVALGDI
jgi:hypothetical protein